MKHPQILPGRGGLPPTSNVPWSAYRERTYRKIILFNFVALLICVGAIVFVVITPPGGWRKVLAIAGLLLLSVFNFWRVLVNRRILGAMLLNKPRDPAGLTQWTEHRWPYPSPVIDPDALRFFCECGRLVDFTAAPFFEATNRWSIVCECGRGHFMARPKHENISYFPSEAKR